MAGQERGPDLHAVRAERERGRDAPPVGDAARGYDGDGTYRVDDLRYQAHGAHHASVPAGFTTLGDDDVGAVLGCELRLLHRRDLLHDEAAGIVHTFHVVTCVVERERDDGRCALEGRSKGVFIEIRHDVIHRNGTFCQVAKLGELAAELVRWTVPGAEAAERAGVGDRGGQRGRCEDAHPCLDDGNLDAYEVTQWRTQPDPLHPAKRVPPT